MSSITPPTKLNVSKVTATNVGYACNHQILRGYPSGLVFGFFFGFTLSLLGRYPAKWACRTIVVSLVGVAPMWAIARLFRRGCDEVDMSKATITESLSYGVHNLFDWKDFNK
eukprot:TRINITY_DN5909_c0_g1_i1.p1 TRINITY_DN5909_c0_g1~~TRINITY_DN5909_c0_g1_i1.p1  ORF type:complete len:127 (-),score=14.65 TRINITY_DN5909_c0_g1_i1:19-354(-)